MTYRSWYNCDYAHLCNLDLGTAEVALPEICEEDCRERKGYVLDLLDLILVHRQAGNRTCFFNPKAPRHKGKRHRQNRGQTRLGLPLLKLDSVGVHFALAMRTRSVEAGPCARSFSLLGLLGTL